MDLKASDMDLKEPVMGIYEKVVFTATRALESLSKSNKKPITGRSLHEWVKKNQDDFEFDITDVESSWGVYLTRAVADPKTRIAREPGKYSYILEDKSLPVEVRDIEEQPISKELSDEKSKNQQRELKLYHLLSDWLRSVKYNASVTYFTKRGKTWGNPDITGILVDENILGQRNIELATIEAKTSVNNWRKEFFEAVSHKRFSNRAYFAFAFPAKEATLASLELIPEYSEMRKYAEKYKVGLLAVLIEPSQYSVLLKEDLNSNFEISLEDVVVVELWPAVFDFVPNSDINFFLSEVLGLKNLGDIYQFGRQ